MPSWISALFAPIAGIFTAREQRKAAKEAALGKLAQASQEGALKVELNKDEYEIVATQGLASTWKDEYATVSVVSILNIIVIGGVASAFGHPEVLEGIIASVVALTEVGVDVGFLLEATVLAAIGLSVWKKF
jgi:hypothetical protein